MNDIALTLLLLAESCGKMVCAFAILSQIHSAWTNQQPSVVFHQTLHEMRPIFKLTDMMHYNSQYISFLVSLFLFYRFENGDI